MFVLENRKQKKVQQPSVRVSSFQMRHSSFAQKPVSQSVSQLGIGEWKRGKKVNLTKQYLIYKIRYHHVKQEIMGNTVGQKFIQFGYSFCLHPFHYLHLKLLPPLLSCQ